MDTAQLMALSDAIVEQARPLLAGNDPRVQGAALAELTAMWVAGHSPEAREAIMELQFTAVREMVPGLAAELWGKLQ